VEKNVNIKGIPDKRLVQRLISKGEMSEDELKDFIAALPDVSENAEEIKVTLEECEKNRVGS
jgi:polyhydroxyalkanoate synthesis regulator phasin